MVSDAGDALVRCRDRRPVFGVVQTMANTVATELAILAGFDFVILDCEHGIVDEAVHLACLQLLAPTQCFSAVRVRPGDLGAVGRYVEWGADAVLLPDLRNADEAAAFVAAASEGPRGTRSSTSASRLARYGLAQPGRQPLLFALLESGEAADQADRIAAVDGINGLVIGPNDLAADLGVQRSFDAACYRAAVEKIEQAALRHGSILGTRPAGSETAAQLLDRSYTMLIAGADVIAMRDGFRAQLAATRPSS